MTLESLIYIKTRDLQLCVNLPTYKPVITMDKNVCVFILLELVSLFPTSCLTQSDDCKSIYECPAALSILIKNETNARSTIDEAKCGVDGLLPKVKCNHFSPPELLFDRFDTGESGTCVSLYSCSAAVTLIRNKREDPETIKILQLAHCGYEGRLALVKCNVVIQKLEEQALHTQLSKGRDGPLPPCVTPNGYKGLCVELSACPKVKEDGRKYPKFLESSRCDPSNADIICCGLDYNYGNECGVSKNSESTDKIYGGVLTKKNDYPWMVLLRYNHTKGQEVFKCGGSLINSQFVLTAAHCLTDSLKGVRVGAYINQDPKDTYRDVAIIQRKRHKKYKYKGRNFDIAILYIERVPYQDNIRWICLPTTRWKVPTNLTVVGYGANDKGIAAFTRQFKADLPVIREAVCAEAYAGPPVDQQGILCAGGEPGTDSCDGDSGGPLIGKNKTLNWYLYGIVSGGAPDCSLGFPGIYTRVDAYLPWIKERMLEML